MITGLHIFYIKIYLELKAVLYISCMIRRFVAFVCRYILTLIAIYKYSEWNYILVYIISKLNFSLSSFLKKRCIYFYSMSIVTVSFFKYFTQFCQCTYSPVITFTYHSPLELYVRSKYKQNYHCPLLL